MAEAQPQGTDHVDEEQFENLDRHAERLRAKDERSEVIEAVPSIIMRGALYCFIAVIVISTAIAYFTKVHVKVNAKGIIVPEGQNVAVEAREAGIITEVHVAAGDDIKKGDAILTLQRSESRIDLRTIAEKLNLEQAKRGQLANARRVAQGLLQSPEMASEKEPSHFVNAGPALSHVNNLRAKRKLHQTNTENIKEFEANEKKMTLSQIGLAGETLRRRRRNLETAKKTLETRTQVLDRRKTELAQMEDLAKRKIVPTSQVSTARDNLIQAEGRVNEQNQRISQMELEISRSNLNISNQRTQLAKREKALKDAWDKSRTEVDQAMADIGSAITTFDNTIGALDATINSLRSKLQLQRLQIEHLKVISPVAGTITAMKFTTAGRHVARGNPIATIVPEDARPMVLAFVKNKDVAFIKKGIEARVKVDAYPFRQFGTVPATVTRVYPLPDKPQFAVRMEMGDHNLKVRGERVELKPGLTLQADLLTEKRRIIELILKKMK